MRIPILTYHSMKIDGNDYGNNDHVALAEDLETIDRGGFSIRPLHEVVALWSSAPHRLRGERIVALTCDDGGDFDFDDLPHPVAGTQRSMLNILRDFRSAKPEAQPGLSITSFVIVSPAARVELDRTCMIGRGWWNEGWWPKAVSSGLMGIASHSWDHNHETLAVAPFPEVPRGTFKSIDTETMADHEIAQAQSYLVARAPNPDAAIFGYPYGETNDFLVHDYLPRRGPALGITAAVSDGAKPMTETSDRWQIPRFVFGRDWKAPGDLQRILDDARRG